MAREIETPRIDPDKENIAIVGIIEVGRMRVDELPKIDAEHVQEDKRLLEKAVTHLNSLRIFPTAELRLLDENDSQTTVSEQLLFVASTPLHSDYVRNYYLNPQGELLSYLQVGKKTILRNPASNKEYITYTADALHAIEKRIQNTMDNQPEPRVTKKGVDIGQKLFSGIATPADAKDWVKDYSRS